MPVRKRTTPARKPIPTQDQPVNAEVVRNGGASESLSQFQSAPEPTSVPIRNTVKAETREQSIQRKRKMLSKRSVITDRNLLDCKSEKGYRQRWVNDVDDGLRIREMQELGFDIVRDVNARTEGRSAHVDSQLGAAVTRSVGGGVTAYLMRIEDEVYGDIQGLKQRIVDESEEAMKKPKVSARNPNPDGTYGGIEVARNT